MPRRDPPVSKPLGNHQLSEETSHCTVLDNLVCISTARVGHLNALSTVLYAYYYLPLSYTSLQSTRLSHPTRPRLTRKHVLSNSSRLIHKLTDVRHDPILIGRLIIVECVSLVFLESGEVSLCNHVYEGRLNLNQLHLNSWLRCYVRIHCWFIHQNKVFIKNRLRSLYHGIYMYYHTTFEVCRFL